MTSKRASAHLRRRHTALSTALMLMAAVVPHATEAAELRVFSTGAPSAAAKVIAAKFSTETGYTVAFTVGQLAAIQQKLAAGEQADVAIVFAHRHVVDHALAQRRDRLGHRWLLSVGLHERAILADRTPPTDDPTPIETANGPKGIYGRRSL